MAVFVVCAFCACVVKYDLPSVVAVENRFEMKLENPLSVVGAAEVSRGFEYAPETSARLLNGSRKDESIKFCLKILARYISNAPRIDCHDYRPNRFAGSNKRRYTKRTREFAAAVASY